jgi:citronellol/citronellal dehydrogenase
VAIEKGTEAPLAGKTVFVTGASRGIGKAIALRAARDGANIVIASKTAEPHRTLEGTIFTAAEEVVSAGGQALPLQVDIRDEKQTAAAVEKTVEQFGSIDILINNASAISLTGTLETPMRRVDLMFGVNVRGTYATSQACLPELLKAENPHILNISPPLSLNPQWFKDHTAYTIAKYGMSMCVLGMAAEFADQGVAVNALWPRTVIATAAIRMLGGLVKPEQCRVPEIMADAAHCVVSGDSRARTGQFLIDDEVLSAAGVSEFDQYAVAPGTPLALDLFLD